MPRAVDIFAETHDIGKVVAYQGNILELYRLDIAKYAIGGDKLKIRAIFDSILSQLNEKNRRFILSNIDSNSHQNRINCPVDVGAALSCYNVTRAQPPLQLNMKHNLFKFFMSDTGLICGEFPAEDR